MLVIDFPVLPDEFQIFSPINTLNLRNQSVEAIFRDLGNEKLTLQQKNFLVAQCLDELNDLPDIKFGDSGNQLKRRYNIPIGTVNFWISAYKAKRNCHDKVGRPPALDEIAIKAAIAEIAAGSASKKGVRKSKKRLLTANEVGAVFSKQARLTSERAGKDIDVEDEQLVLCPNTIKRLVKVLNLMLQY